MTNTVDMDWRESKAGITSELNGINRAIDELRGSVEKLGAGQEALRIDVAVIKQTLSQYDDDYIKSVVEATLEKKRNGHSSGELTRTEIRKLIEEVRQSRADMVKLEPPVVVTEKKESSGGLLADLSIRQLLIFVVTFVVAVALAGERLVNIVLELIKAFLT